MTNSATGKAVMQENAASRKDREVVTSAAVPDSGTARPAADGMAVLMAVDQAIGAELLDAEKILADELHSENPYVCDILELSSHEPTWRHRNAAPFV